MKNLVAFFICASYITIYQSYGINLIEVSQDVIRDFDTKDQLYKKNSLNRFIPIPSFNVQTARRQASAKDLAIKEIIKRLVLQKIADAEAQLNSIMVLKSRSNGTAEYRAGFLMSETKRSRDKVNEIFQYSITHFGDLKGLEMFDRYEHVVKLVEDSASYVLELDQLSVRNGTATTTSSRALV